MSNTFNFSLRMPEELGETIYSLSKESKIPMNSYLVTILENGIREKTRKRKTPLPKFERKTKKDTI